MPLNNRQPNDDLRGDIQQLMHVLQDNRSALTDKIGELDKKMDDVPIKIDQLRKEMITMFVTRSEYDPKHSILENRIAKVESRMDNGQAIVDDYQRVKTKAEQNTQDIRDLELRMSSSASRIIPWIAMVITILGFVLTLLQHVQVK